MQWKSNTKQSITRWAGSTPKASAVTHRLPECKSSRCACGISCLTFSKNTLSLSLLGLLHLSKTLTQQHTLYSLRNNRRLCSIMWATSKISLQIYKAYICFNKQTLMNESVTYSKLLKSLCTVRSVRGFWVSHRVRWSRESPQRWGLLGSAEFCHQCFRMYCPVPWHQSINRKPYTGLTPLFRFTDRVRTVPE